MPNIELHGFGREDAGRLRKRIWKLIKDKPYRDECVVSFIPSVVTNYHGRPKPFLRLVTARDEDHAKSLIELLRSLGHDIEVLEIAQFI